MNDIPDQTATAHGAGNSVNLNLGSGFREAGRLISGLIIALVVSSALAIVGYLKALDAEQKASECAFWGMRVETQFVANGFKIEHYPRK